ncbi:MAG: M28 family peptidase [Planctomycetes bacterium]|nr:M28 family peptidase [Planctomycetota bacterium]
MPRPHPLRPFAAISLAAAALGVVAGCATDGSTTVAPAEVSAANAPTGRAEKRPAAERSSVVRGPSRVTEFRPKSKAVAVDARTVDLKQVFEDLGPDATLWYQHVQTLANPYFEGRVNGSVGIERARDYIEFFYRSYGLEPAFPDAATETPGGATNATWVSYEQPFEFSARRRVEVNVANEHADIAGDALDVNADFAILGNSGTGSVTGPVTFVGYGIAEGPDGYSSFGEDTDLTGRIALLLRYEPLNADGVSRWADGRFSPQAGMARKMSAVQERGAAGIILVNPPGARDGRTGLEPLDRSRRFGRALDIPVIQITPDAAERLLAAGDPAGRDLMAWRRMADDEGPTIVDLADSAAVSFGADVERIRSGDQIPAANVGAVLPGRGDLADEWLVIGGHLDHNGYGMFGTEPSQGPLFPGADDNASGIAGILILAKLLSEWYADTGDDDLRSVLFIAFDAEERGLHGSRHYSQNPTIAPEKMTALLNMDMIGRLRSDRLSIMGTGTAVDLEEILDPHFRSSGLTIASTPAGSGRSDDANFDRMGVPAMHFFTGMHPEYTSPADQAYTVNPAGAGKIMDVMYAIAADLVTRPDKLQYTKPGAIRGQDRGYARVRLGIRPGMSEREYGILIDGVSEGTSAAEGGMRAGDVMLTWDGETLDSMRTLMEKLQGHKPGDVVQIAVQRGEEEVDLTLTLKASEGREGGRPRPGSGG